MSGWIEKSMEVLYTACVLMQNDRLVVIEPSRLVPFRMNWIDEVESRSIVWSLRGCLSAGGREV